MRFHSIPRLSVLLAFALTLGSEVGHAQDLHPSRRLSPIGIARTHIGDTYAKVTYGRPYVRQRAIFGADNDSTTLRSSVIRIQRLAK